MKHTMILGGALVALLSTTGYTVAEDKAVNMIQCGDTLAETYPEEIVMPEPTRRRLGPRRHTERGGRRHDDG